MRRIFLLFLLGLLLCLLTACQRDVLQHETRASDPALITSPTEPTDAIEPTYATKPTEPAEEAWSHEAALANLLEETNRSGEYDPGAVDMPGTLPDVSLIPQPSADRLGETVSVILAQKQKSIPFYYCCTQSGEERLAVFIPADRIPMLVVFETDLGGIKGLLGCIQSETVFEGRILSMTNITYEEGNVYAKSMCSNSVSADDILTSDTALFTGQCLGVVGTYGDQVLSVVRGGVYETASDSLKSDIDWMVKVFKRYSLEDSVLIPADAAQ